MDKFAETVGYCYTKASSSLASVGSDSTLIQCSFGMWDLGIIMVKNM